MSNIFNTSRFGKLILSDANKYMSRYFGTFMIFLLMMPVIWAFNVFVGDTISPSSRFNTIMALTVVTALIAPFRAYSSVNNKKWGVDFVMLPASSLEKFLVMLLMTVVIIPFMFITLSVVIDYFLYILPLKTYASSFPIYKLFSIGTLKYLGYLTLAMSISLFGNMFFRRNKMFKTILSTFIFMIIFSTIAAVYFKGKIKLIENSDDNYSLSLGASSEDGVNANIEVKKNTVYVNGIEVKDGNITSINAQFEEVFKVEEIILYILFYAVIPGLCYFFTYYKIKNEEL